MLAMLPDHIEVGGDPVRPYVLLMNSHDGSTAVVAATTPIRVVTGEMWISMWLELGRRGGSAGLGFGQWVRYVWSGMSPSRGASPEGERRETGGRLLLAHYRRRKGKHKPDGLLLDVGARARPVSARGCYFSSRAQSRRMSSARPLPPNEHE